ncbi:MAG TPA: glycosyltransferase family 39 protein, partial [Acidimicrobiia bacterium]|nr:glycosyltransferase family 39 protein [Acidimicrobiia bacterium]
MADRRGPGWAALALAVIGAGWAIAVSALVFPELSDNKDEAVYLLQAETLRRGHLFPPAPAPADAFTPWLGVPAGDHFVLKYTPVHAGIIAVAGTVFGHDRAALGVIAAAAILACYLLARELSGNATQGLVAAAFFTASPLFLVQSATFLSYLSTLTLLMVFAAALVGGVRRQSPVWLLASGFALGMALFSRPFDTLLFAAPLGGWWLVGRGATGRRLAREARWLALGGAAPAAAMMWYCRLATGSYLRLPFTLTDPTDTLGFGLRRMFPGQVPIDYTPVEAIQGAVRLGGLTGVWVFGGFALMALAVTGWRSASGPARWLGFVAVTVPLGYGFFWGSYGSTQWGGPWRYGPFYWLPVLVPLV